jgi:hypothetical protein
MLWTFSWLQSRRKKRKKPLKPASRLRLRSPCAHSKHVTPVRFAHNVEIGSQLKVFRTVRESAVLFLVVADKRRSAL